MEQIVNNAELVRPVFVSGDNDRTDNKQKTFIEANTITMQLEEIKNNHIIPVFVKDNEPLISHAEFVDVVSSVTADVFNGEQILKPDLRVSHPVKGRIPEAKDKPAQQLQDWEKTIYYERMAFVIEVPSIHDTIDGNKLSLTIGGVKAFNLDNLYSRTTSDQHFTIFIGFKNTVCTNMCVWTDGYMEDVKVKNIGQLKAAVTTLLRGYNQSFHLFHLKQFTAYSITDQQFAHLVGRCRMYNHLPSELKTEIPPMYFGDQQMSSVVKDFYRDQSFCRDGNGNINLWKLYNLFTGANKSTYIDSFIGKSVNAFNLVEQIRHGLENKTACWYLS